MPPESANHRTAFTLYLADPTNRAPGNTVGEEEWRVVDKGKGVEYAANQGVCGIGGWFIQ